MSYFIDIQKLKYDDSEHYVMSVCYAGDGTFYCVMNCVINNVFVNLLIAGRSC